MSEKKKNAIDDEVPDAGAHDTGGHDTGGNGAGVSATGTHGTENHAPDSHGVGIYDIGTDFDFSVLIQNPSGTSALFEHIDAARMKRDEKIQEMK